MSTKLNLFENFQEEILKYKTKILLLEKNIGEKNREIQNFDEKLKNLLKEFENNQQIYIEDFKNLNQKNYFLKESNENFEILIDILKKNILNLKKNRNELEEIFKKHLVESNILKIK